MPDSRRLRFPLSELRSFRPDLLVTEYDRAHFALTALAATVKVPRVAVRVLPNYDTWSQRTWWREAGKQLVFRAVDGAKVPGPDGAALARRYGLPAARIHQVAQTIDIDHFGGALGVPPDVRRDRRAQLGLTGCVFLYAGRLWRGKGVDHLLDAFLVLRRSEPDTSLLLVGDGTDEDRYRARGARIPGVVFMGFVQPELLPDAYALADVFVFPTLGDPHGLVVEEAMAAGLPVVSTSAAGDIRARVPAPERYVVRPGDPDALAGAMLRLSRDPGERARLSEEGIRRVARLGHDRYAADFGRFVDGVLGAPARGGSLVRAVRRVLASTASRRTSP